MCYWSVVENVCSKCAYFTFNAKTVVENVAGTFYLFTVYKTT